MSSYIVCSPLLVHLFNFEDVSCHFCVRVSGCLAACHWVFLWVHIYVQLCVFVLLSCTQSYSLFRRLRSLMCWWIRCASAVYPCMRWGLPVRSYQSGTCNSVSMRSVWLTTFWLTDWLTNHVWVCVCAHPHTHLLGVALMCAWLLPSMW